MHDLRHTPANLLISENFPPHVGGSSRWFWELYRRLPGRQVVAAGEHEDAAAIDADAGELEIHRLPLTMSHWGLSNWGALRGYHAARRRLGGLVKQIQRRGGELPIVHAGRCLPEGWLAWLLSLRHGLRYAVYVHGEDVTTAATSREYRWMVRRVFARAKLIIANSHNTADILQRDWQLTAPRVQVLQPGVDTQRFRPAPRNDVVRRMLGWEGRTVLLTVGRLQRRKGHDHMIAALARLKERYPDVLYAICGEGEERGSLEALVEQHGLRDRVQFLGAATDDELRACYQQCDLFALPNRTLAHDIEGFGMVLVEAQACGAPVLAGDSGGTRETLLPGETGWIADCSTPEALASALEAILPQQPRFAAMGAAGRQWVESQFDWDVLAVRADRLFRELAGVTVVADTSAEVTAIAQPAVDAA